MSRTAIVTVTERCNQACVFCLEEDGAPPRPDPPAADVARALAGLRARGAEHLTFMGGESFLRKDLPSLLAEARRLGFTRVGVATNGTALGHTGLLDRAIEAGLDFVELSVHADDAPLAEAISGRRFTFARQRRALFALEAARDRLRVIVNVVVCRENHRRLPSVVRLLLDEHPRLCPTVRLKFVSVVGAAAAAAPLRYEEVDLAPALALLRARGADFAVHNVPLCRLPDEPARSYEAQALALDWRYFDPDPGDGYRDAGHQLEGNVWPEPCDRCTVAPLCPGLEESYRRVAGDGELLPRADDPLPHVATILVGAGRDPAAAPAVLAALARRPRQRRFVPSPAPPPGEAMLAFHHPSWIEPLWFELGPADGRPAFVAGRRLRLAYRTATRAPGRDIAAHALLEALARALGAADGDGEAIAPAARRLADAAPAGWTCPIVRIGAPEERALTPLRAREPVAARTP